MNNSVIRARTKELVARNWGKMLCMSLLIGVACSAASSILGVIAILLFKVSVVASLIISGITDLILSIVICGLMMGYIASLLKMNADQPVKLTDVFSMLGRSLPVFGLQLWVGLKTFLWMLPGLVLTLVGVLLAMLQSAGTLPALGPIPQILSYVGIVAASIFAIRAAYTYAMSNYAYADTPSVGVFGAVNASKNLMAYSKLELFMLVLPYQLVALAASLALGALAVLFGIMNSILGYIILVLGILALTVLSVYISLLCSMALVCFYKADRH